MGKEEEILRLLEGDARLSTEEIAKVVGLSEGEVAELIKELEESGVIRKYKTVVNWEKLGREKVAALIDVKITPEREHGYDAIAERIMRFPEVKNLYLVSGMYDLSVLVEGSSMKEVAAFVAEKLAPLPQVTSTTTHFILKKYKEDGDMLYDGEELRRLAVSP
ncbi:MAG: Lrp/AsnC family transcriptional regulator [Euryarchaeota archaeon]|nr:Lrp/AsnC family transcriptional regulator [Euryarchaeota archaeon]